MRICVAIIISFIIALSSCHLFEYSASEPTQEMIIQRPEFTLSWDYSDIGLTTEEKEQIYFTIYVKSLEDSLWKKIGISNYKEKSFSIDKTILPPGRYYFAVSAAMSGKISELHSSEDSSAEPINGWHVLWIPTE